MIPLTTIQRETLDVIRGANARGHVPTRRFLANHLGISMRAIEHRLEELRRKGLIRWSGVPAGIVVTNPACDLRVAAAHGVQRLDCDVGVRDWDAWIAEGLAHARRIEAAGEKAEADRIRAYVERRTSIPAEQRPSCVRMRCDRPALPGRPWCDVHAPVFADEARALLRRSAA